MKEMIEIKCETCGKNIFIIKEFMRDKMFCTLGCLDMYQKGEMNKMI